MRERFTDGYRCRLGMCPGPGSSWRPPTSKPDLSMYVPRCWQAHDGTWLCTGWAGDFADRGCDSVGVPQVDVVRFGAGEAKGVFGERPAISRCQLTHLSPNALLPMTASGTGTVCPASSFFACAAAGMTDRSSAPAPRPKLRQTMVIHRSYSGGDTAACYSACSGYSGIFCALSRSRVNPSGVSSLSNRAAMPDARNPAWTPRSSATASGVESSSASPADSERPASAPAASATARSSSSFASAGSGPMRRGGSA